MEHVNIACLFIILFGIFQDASVGACGAFFNSSTGIIKSPQYPSDYPLDTVCEWIIEDPNKNHIFLNIETFILENCCGCDYLEIRYGSSATSPLMGKYCGTTFPRNITSSGYQLYLKFRTDSSVNSSGFYIIWGSAIMDSNAFYSNTRTHGGHLDSLSGVITSPNYPQPYPENLERQWIIEVPKDHQVVLHVKSFVLESEVACAYDYLEIRNGSSAATSTLIGKYCGHNIPEKITCTGDRVFLRFESNGPNNYEGFMIEWNASSLFNNHCGGNLTASRGIISSPHYPELLSSPVECIWNVRVSAGSVIQLVLVDLEFEGAKQCRFDFVEIYEGADASGKRLGTYCQTINHPMYAETTSNVASVQYRSHSAASGRRFRIIYHTICNNKLRGSNGVIESPNFPNDYPYRENCSWVIEAPIGKKLNLTFSQFDLEGSIGDSCSGDYLEIMEREGDGPRTVIGKFCNSTVPPPVIVSTRHQVLVQFYSDNSTSRNGFRLEWIVNDPQKDVGSTTVCGRHFNSSTGLIMSPDYPEHYAVSTVCEWIIEDPNKQRTLINIEKFEVEWCESCTCDYLEIRNGGSATSPLVGKYCGTTIPENILSLGYQMYLKFETDSSRRYPGFNIAWGSATAIGSNIFDGTSQIHGGHFDSPSGVITSPNYPEHYPDNSESEWIVEVPKGQLVILTVKKFEIQPHAKCESDYLEIRNGSSATVTTLVGRYCGTNIPETITCYGDRIFLRFRTDGSLSSAGFVIEWNRITLDCGGSLMANRGTISSQNYPELFKSSIECNWNIQVSAGSVIQLIFVDLEFEAVEQCRFDFIEIYDGSDASGKKLGTYCESINHPQYIETTSNVASVRFRSDSITSGRRFRIIYHSICRNKLHGSTGVIESPNFPNKYPHRENCTWIIEVPVGENLQLTFSEFDLDEGLENSCNNDYLEITEGEDDEPLREIGKFCNSGPPPPMILTTQRQVFLHFYSDNSISRDGFRLEWNVDDGNRTLIPSLSSCVLWGQSVVRRDDYSYMLGNRGHKLHTRAVPWNEARITCEEEGGHLAIINSNVELNAIIQLFENSEPITGSLNPNFASIGFHYLPSEGRFATIHGQSLNAAGFSQWADGQPDNHTDSKICGALSIGGELNAINCGTHYGFICEVPVYRYTDTSSKNNSHQFASYIFLP